MARSYLPSKVSEIVAIWRKDLHKVNPKATKSLANPEEYPNLFEDWQVALSVESRVVEMRGVYVPVYANHADRSHHTLVEAFRTRQVDDEEPLENGDAHHECTHIFVTGYNTTKNTMQRNTMEKKEARRRLL
ncbi:Coatomer subunit beta'-2 [Morella rubra]|uniref:Coatomer subunit beta'-2 n=1 Tax=Morella rubra TaxID=262757 RepID=A0A6A1V074_9ROSI|nr:Coatomer subunit beta'-2 [Morella rubra]